MLKKRAWLIHLIGNKSPPTARNSLNSQIHFLPSWWLKQGKLYFVYSCAIYKTLNDLKNPLTESEKKLKIGGLWKIHILLN